MAFRHYQSIAQVQEAYAVQYRETDFVSVNPTEIPPAFLEEFEFNLNKMDVFSSEGARCELVILPIIRQAYKHYADEFSLWVQKSIRYDAVLNGTPDYIVSMRSELGKTVLKYPLVMIAEAKKNDFDQGWGQCLAELLAAQKLNRDEHLPVYGIVTDGKYWEFGKLEKNIFTKNVDAFLVSDISRLLGALDFIFSLLPKQFLLSHR